MCSAQLTEAERGVQRLRDGRTTLDEDRRAVKRNGYRSAIIRTEGHLVRLTVDTAQVLANMEGRSGQSGSLDAWNGKQLAESPPDRLVPHDLPLGLPLHSGVEEVSRSEKIMSSEFAHRGVRVDHATFLEVPSR